VIAIMLKKRENIDKALRRLKKAVAKEGIFAELKERQYFQKPGDKKRKKSIRARARIRKEERLAGNK